MKSKALGTALDLVKGAVSTELDVVELDGSVIRTSDGQWHAGAYISETFPSTMVLPYSKLRAIVKTIADEEDLGVVQKNVECLIKASTAMWKLNLRDAVIDKVPEFKAVKTAKSSGYDFLDAFKSLRHLMRTDLSRIGLMWGWTNDEGELVIGDGARLGGRKCGLKGVEVPNVMITEIGRMLGVSMTEQIKWIVGEKNLTAESNSGYLSIVVPKGERFPIEYYKNVRAQLGEEAKVIKLSRSDLALAVKQVGITAGESSIKLSSQKAALILESKDEYGERSVSKIEAAGAMDQPVTLDIKHLESAIESRVDEMLTLQVCRSVFGLSDSTGWEILSRR